MRISLAIECGGITKHYPHFQLQNIDLSFEQGTVMGLVGPNLRRSIFFSIQRAYI
jgi:ABC-2 type transport system ATP-binding protein